MNWDISLGAARQITGKLMQAFGSRTGSRKLVLAGERLDYTGRLQVRYGALKHQAQWHWASGGPRRELARARAASPELVSIKRSTFP